MKEIKLTQGKVALVDDADFEWLNQYKWFANKQGNSFYAVRNTPWIDGHRTQVSMHRQILNLTDPNIFGDHRDRNGLNNQRNNLRVATRSQNGTNRRSWGDSKYLGVHKVVYKKGGRQKKDYEYWRATIKEGDKVKLIGLFHDEVEAAKAYNKTAIKIHGEFANLNIIQ